jgi:predicted outer membrane repeat protein
MNRNDTPGLFGRIGSRTMTGVGVGLLAAAAFASLRGGFFTRGANAEFVRPAVAFDALLDGTIDVPSEASSLQAALDFAPDGATVRLAPGTYAGAVSCSGKSISIVGAGEGATVIRGFGHLPVMSFAGDGSQRVSLRGVSLVGGSGQQGCGLRLDNVSYDIRNARITGNQGGGTVISGGSGSFEGCAFELNHGPASGGAVSTDGGNATFVGCSFRRNTSDTFGGAVYSAGGHVSLLACSLEDNSTRSGAWGGAVFGKDAVVELHGSDFARNRSIESGGAVYLLGGVADVSRCSFTGNSSGEARSLFSRGAGVRIGSSRMCGAAETALGGDYAFGDENVFDAACFGDCNQNGIPDSEEIAMGWARDVDGNGIPDSCDPDCNQNGIPDAYEIATGLAQDANRNGIIDVCEIRAGLALDADHDGVPDDAQQLVAPAMGAAPAVEPAPVPDPYMAPGPGGLMRHGDLFRQR